jgi:glycosyltransferase involved in cell wall biosynthesis
VPDPPLRACILISRYAPDFSGQGIQVERMLPFLRDEGIDVEIVTCRAQSGVTGRAEDPVPVERILISGHERLAQLQRLLRLSVWFRRNVGRFDVLHTIILDWGVYLNLPYLERHGIPVLNEMILLGSDDPLSIARQELGRFKLERLRRHVDLWVGLTASFLPSVREAGIPEDRFRVLMGGVDVKRYRPLAEDERRAVRDRLGIPPEARLAISVGSVQHRKGFDRVLKAWAASRPQAGRDLLLIVGPASRADGLRPRHAAYADEIRAAAEQPPLAGTVRVVGRVGDLHDWMGASDTMVFLSRREGLGFVILEALACGLPCIVSPLDGIARELLIEGETGFVMDDPDDPQAVARALERLRERNPRVERMRELARRTAVERFSMGARAKGLADLYRGLARGRKA